jgi:acetyl esterase/lipase
MRFLGLLLLSASCGISLAAVSPAQTAPAPAMPVFKVTAAPALDETGEIPLTGKIDHGGEVWNQFALSRVVRNVTRPTIKPFLPTPGTATGAAVVIAPGGGFMMLSMDSEGYDVAKWLAARGVTAFVLKYRLETTAVDPEEFQKQMFAMMTSARDVTRELPGEPRAVEYGLAAMRYVRSHAAQWNIDADRIGFMGFSAGGMTTSGVATRYDAASLPAFAGIIYGAMQADAVVPADAPPTFIALAADDQLLSGASYPIFRKWQDAKHPAELHIYQRGGHGFGMNPTHGSADRWIDEFYWWLESNGLLKKNP